MAAVAAGAAISPATRTSPKASQSEDALHGGPPMGLGDGSAPSARPCGGAVGRFAPNPLWAPPRIRCDARPPLRRRLRACSLEVDDARAPSRRERRRDRRLIRALRKQNPEAIALLQERHGAMLLGYLTGVLGDRATAEDVLQVTLTEVWQRGPAYDPARASLLTWVMLIARSRALDQLRRRVPEPHDPRPRRCCCSTETATATPPAARRRSTRCSTAGRSRRC